MSVELLYFFWGLIENSLYIISDTDHFNVLTTDTRIITASVF
jgi:hypothetical protein